MAASKKPAARPRALAFKRGKFDRASDDGYKRTPCWFYGPFAIHRTIWGSWRLSHAATGHALTQCDSPNHSRVRGWARYLADVIDWSKIRRTRRASTVAGLTQPMKAAVCAALALRAPSPATGMEARKGRDAKRQRSGSTAKPRQPGRAKRGSPKRPKRPKRPLLTDTAPAWTPTSNKQEG